MEFLAFISVIAVVCLAAAFFLRGVQGIRGGQRISLKKPVRKMTAYVSAHQGKLAMALSFCLKTLTLPFKLLYAFFRSMELRRASADQSLSDELKDSIKSVESILGQINPSIYFLEMEEIKKDSRRLKRDFDSLRKSEPSLLVDGYSWKKEYDGRLELLIQTAEGLEERAKSLYRRQEREGFQKQDF